MKAESLIILSCTVNEIPGNYLIYPAQPAHLIGDTVSWVGPNNKIYNSDTLFPGNIIRIVDQGVFDGARIMTLEVKPIQYRPKTKRLFLTSSIKLKIAYGTNVMPPLKAQRRGKFEQGVYDAALLDIVTNDNEIPSYYSTPNLVDEGQLASMALFPAAPFVVITPSEFASAFQPYVDWLVDQGISATMISQSLINFYFSGADDAEKARNYIKYVYEHNGGTYFILGGDDGYAPIRCAWDPYVAYDTIVPCDMYFSDLTGNWDVNNNHRWGEVYSDSADRFPEVFVGRITAYNSQEVANWVTKALSFEKTPGVLFDTVLWVYDTLVDTGATPEVFPQHITQIYGADYYADQALNMLNKGYGLVNTNCHGNIQTFRTRHDPNADIKSFWSSPPSWDYAGLNYLNNPNKYSLIYSICCVTACYEGILSFGNNDPASDTCIMDAFMDAYRNMSGTPLGSCAYLGNTRAGIFYSSFHLQYAFWDRIMNPWWTGYGPPEPSITRIGVAEALSKCDEKISWHPDTTWDRHVCYSHNLFGSPYTESWTKSPKNMSVTHPGTIYVGQQVQFTVTVKTTTFPPTPLQYAKVCLNKPGDVYMVGSTNSSGQVTFTFTPQSTGTLKVTVTRLHSADNNYNQYRPSQTTCQVVSGGGGQSSGSNDLSPATLCIRNLPAVLHGNTSIRFEIPEKGELTVSIIDVTGARIQLVMRRHITPGFYQKRVVTDALANGVYFITLELNNKKVSQKFLLVK
jgi:hypothetical protein